MYLAYLDDSSDESYQIMTATVVPDNKFMTIEEYLASVIDEFVPEDKRDTFEFHASAMFHGKPPFENLTRDDVLKIFEKCASIVVGAPLQISYGGVNMRNLRGGLYATAKPADVAFRLCLAGLESILVGLEEDNRKSATGIHALRHEDFGILICDEHKMKDELQKAFRANRRRLKSGSHNRGLLLHLHDDLYFGDSAYSVGIQITDICGFIILRHLENKHDTEYLYKMIEPQIRFGEVQPSECRQAL